MGSRTLNRKRLAKHFHRMTTFDLAIWWVDSRSHSYATSLIGVWSSVNASSIRLRALWNCD